MAGVRFSPKFPPGMRKMVSPRLWSMRALLPVIVSIGGGYDEVLLIEAVTAVGSASSGRVWTSIAWTAALRGSSACSGKGV